LGVRDQFRRQGEAACHALLLEVRANYDALTEMTKLLSTTGWAAGKANPGWLNQSIWDSQVAYVAQLLDPRTLNLVVQAYSTLAAVPEMRWSREIGPQGHQPYLSDGWVNDHITKAYEAFRSATEYLGEFVAEMDRKAKLPRTKKIDAWFRGLLGRPK
jgi:hypothetical protein